MDHSQTNTTHSLKRKPDYGREIPSQFENKASESQNNDRQFVNPHCNNYTFILF